MTTFVLMKMPLLFLFIFSTILASNAQVLDSTRIVKVLSFNILHGSTTNGDFDLDVLADLIQSTDADLVALQEVDFKTNRAKKYDLVTELGWRTQMAPIFGRAMPYDGGEYGEGILSRFSFHATKNIGLPFIEGQEPRAVLQAEVLLPSSDTVVFIGTHLSHEGPEGRILQVKKINQLIAEGGKPTILAGDLNDVPGSEAIEILEKHWTATYDKENPEGTYSSTKPERKIDYVMVYPKENWQVLKREVICDPIASDHCVYLVSLYLVGR